MYKFKLLRLVLTGKISLKYWLKFNGTRVAWVYTDKNISIDNENMYDFGFGLTMVGEDMFQLPDGTTFRQSESKAIYLLENGKMILCEIIKDNKLTPIQKEQITLDFPKTEIIRLRNKAKEKNLSLKDYLLQQISSIL